MSKHTVISTRGRQVSYPASVPSWVAEGTRTLHLDCRAWPPAKGALTENIWLKRPLRKPKIAVCTFLGWNQITGSAAQEWSKAGWREAPAWQRAAFLGSWRCALALPEPSQDLRASVPAQPLCWVKILKGPGSPVVNPGRWAIMPPQLNVFASSASSVTQDRRVWMPRISEELAWGKQCHAFISSQGPGVLKVARCPWV